MHGLSETTLFEACRTLFGQDIRLSREFLDILQPNGVRAAFRSKAKAHHPDRHAAASPQVRIEQTDRFRELRQAYDLLIAFLEKRSRLCPSPSRQDVREQAPTHVYRRPAGQRPPAKPFSRQPVVPSIFLEFGMFAYYQGAVTYPQLIEALVWQRRQRPTLGVIACDWGWLSEARVRRIIDYRGKAVRFGRKAIELGYLNPRQVEALLQHQRSLQLRIGRYFVEQGLMSEEKAEELARELKMHNQRTRRQMLRSSSSQGR